MGRWWLVAMALVAGCATAPAAPSPPPSSCLLPPAFDPGAGELSFCPPADAERALIAYARRSYLEDGLREDIWLNVRGVFADALWVNVGVREANDTSQPAWGDIERLIGVMQAIGGGDADALARFLAPIEQAPTPTADDRALKAELLARLRATARQPAGGAVRAVLYHVHLRPTREIEERSQMPINHALSIPSHGDLLWAPRIAGLAPGSEAKIAVPAGIWTYAWDERRAMGFVAERYDGPPQPPFFMKFAHVYTRFAITEYHRFGFNDPLAVLPEPVRAYIAALEPAGTVLDFAFAPDWDTARRTLAERLRAPAR